MHKKDWRIKWVFLGIKRHQERLKQVEHIGKYLLWTWTSLALPTLEAMEASCATRTTSWAAWEWNSIFNLRKPSYTYHEHSTTVLDAFSFEILESLSNENVFFSSHFSILRSHPSWAERMRLFGNTCRLLQRQEIKKQSFLCEKCAAKAEKNETIDRFSAGNYSMQIFVFENRMKRLFLCITNFFDRDRTDWK